MTEIQYKTWHAAVQGRDVIARSRTGSGKTLAFLLPAVERLLRDPSKLGNGQIRLLVVSPTRELAHQISEAVRMVTADHDRRLTSQVVYGGVPKHKDLRHFARTKPSILTATPGRLLDHLQSSILEVDGGVPFVDTVKDVDILVLDEMDRCVRFRSRCFDRFFSNGCPHANAIVKTILLFLSQAVGYGIPRRYSLSAPLSASQRVAPDVVVLCHAP